MEKDTNIIAIRKTDKPRAHKCFVDLMEKTEKILNADAQKQSEYYKKLSPSDLEDCSVEKIREACADSPFDGNEVKLISGQRFPDIIANTYYGVEVKSTKTDHWTSTGSSIVESTRDMNVDDLYMLFGKLGGKIPEFKCRPYEDVLYDIAVTHSPRYLINMEINKKETIFAKMGTTYDSFRTSPDAIDQVRHYYKEKAQRARRVEMPWWITSENVENPRSFNIALWNTLPLHEKNDLQVTCMILFPEALNPAYNPKKYNRTTLWLCSYHQVIVPNIRDFYSAGGKVTHVDGQEITPSAPQVFARIVKYAETVKTLLSSPSKELLMLIEDYNPQLLKGDNWYENWLNICLRYAQKANVPLQEWIDKKPVFTYSKNNLSIHGKRLNKE